MARPLPPFAAPTTAELRQIWSDYPESDIRRLVLEVERGRRVIAEIVRLTEGVDGAWRREVGGNQSSLFALKQVLATETHRGIIDVAPYPNAPNY